MVGALLHEPRDAARHHQLGHADHRPARSRARAAHHAARPRVGDPRLHDRLDRARPHRGPAVRPLRPQAGLRRRLRRLRAHLAGRRLRRERHGADPVADPPGHRRRVPVRQRRRARDRRVPARAARAGDGHQHDDRRGRPRARAGAGRRARLDLVAVGVLVQRPVRARRRRVGLRRPPRARAARHQPRARPARDHDVRRGPDRARARRLQGRHLGLERPGRDRRPRRRRRAAAAVRRHRAPRPRADARPHDLREPDVLRGHRRRVHQRAVAASR